jgi:uncharacterized membrane protein (UPF0127 family)
VLVEAESGTVVAHDVWKASGFLDRALGLLARPKLRLGDALWLEPCNGVHTFGMRYTIAVITLNARGEVVRLTDRLSPNRILLPARSGAVTIEMLPETLERSGLRLGGRLILASPGDVGL